LEKESNIISIFEKDNKAMQDNIQVVIDFLEEQFPVVDFITVKALAYIPIKELA
jgi:hypothetical protein